jgi:hypothetical protein
MRFKVAAMRLKPCFNDCWRFGTTWDYWQKNMTQWQSGSWGISLRPGLICHWLTRRIRFRPLPGQCSIGRVEKSKHDELAPEKNLVNYLPDIEEGEAVDQHMTDLAFPVWLLTYHFIRKITLMA